MLSNAYLLAKFRFDTAENEQKFAEILTAASTVDGDGFVDRRCVEPEGQQRRGLRRGAVYCATELIRRTNRGENGEEENCKRSWHRFQA